MKEISFRNDILPLKEKLFRTALRITMDSAEAEDVVQDTLIRVWNKREEWPNIISIEAYCMTICRNLALDRNERMGTDYIEIDEQVHKLTDATTTPSERLEQQESLKRRIKRARFPIIKRLNDFNYQFQPSINPQQIAEFATMSFLDNQENIIFIGSPGVGKTHLSIGLGIEACRQGVRTLFINCHELILRLKAAQEKQHLERVMRRYKRYDLLIIDELGYLPITADEAKLLFQLINGRYERKSTIITTNVPLSSWGTVLHSTATAEAILDRLVYHSHVIKIKGKSYRLASVNS